MGGVAEAIPEAESNAVFCQGLRLYVSRLRDAFGRRCRRGDLAERIPGELKEGLTGDGIDRSEVGDTRQ